MAPRGRAVFAGMLGVTLFGLVFTPVFYVLSRQAALLFATVRHSRQVEETTTASGGWTR
jgi:HAE1 family hydrophobic/amphiphilic exporter-1